MQQYYYIGAYRDCILYVGSVIDHLCMYYGVTADISNIIIIYATVS